MSGRVRENDVWGWYREREGMCRDDVNEGKERKRNRLLKKGKAGAWRDKGCRKRD